MFQELQKKAKAVLKKVQHSSSAFHDSSHLKRRSSDYSKKFRYTTDQSHHCHGDLDESSNDRKGQKFKIEINSNIDDGFVVCDRPQQSFSLDDTFANSKSPISINYPLNTLLSFLRDNKLVKQHHIQIEGWTFFFIVVILSFLMLMSDDYMFVHGFMCGIGVVVLCLTFYFLYTHAQAYDLHSYCSDLRDLILTELQNKSHHFDMTDVPKSGIVDRLAYCYKGWIYLTNDYDSNKPLSDLNPCIAFLSFGKQSLSIYVIEIIGVENKKGKFNNFNVVKHYRLNYSRLEFGIVPENLPIKKYWSKKLPIKLSYPMGALVCKRMDPFVSSYQKILSKMDDSDPCGPLPIPNAKFNNTSILLDYNGGDIYLFALTSREKERWYRSFRICVDSSPGARSRQFRDMSDFSTVSVDPFAVKIDYIKRIKDLITHYKSINSVEPFNQYRTSSTHPSSQAKHSSSKCNSPNSNYYLNKKNPYKDNSRMKPKKNKSNLTLNVCDDLALEKAAVNDKSLPLNYNTAYSSTNLDSATTSSNLFTSENIKKQSSTEKFYFLPDDQLTMDYILSAKSALALNLLAYRLMWDFWREVHWTDVVKTKIQTKINSLRLPPFIKKLTIDQLDLGDQLPAICSNCDPILDNEGGLWLHFPLVYNGKLSFTFNTQLDVSVYDQLIVKASKATDGASSFDINLSSDGSSVDCASNDDPTATFSTIDDPTATFSTIDDPSVLMNLEIIEETANVILNDEIDNNNVECSYNLESTHKNKPLTPSNLNIPNDTIPTTNNPSNIFLSNINKNQQSTIDETLSNPGCYTKSINSLDPLSNFNISSTTLADTNKVNNDKSDDKNESDDVIVKKINALLNSKSGKKLFNVVEKLAQSPFVKKIGRSEFAKKVYKAAKKKINGLNVILTVNVTSVKGTLVLYIPPPPSDRLWFSFKSLPVAALQISTRINTKNIKLPMLTQFIDSKIKSEFRDVLVLPNMDDIYVPILSSDTKSS